RTISFCVGVKDLKPMSKYMNLQLITIVAVSLLVACTNSVSNADKLVESGISAYLNGDNQIAVDTLNQALESPEDIHQEGLETVYTILGNAYNQLDNYEM